MICSFRERKIQVENNPHLSVSEEREKKHYIVIPGTTNKKKKP